MLPPIPADAMPAAQFLMRHLYRPLELTANRGLFAVTETETLVDGDNWFWTDDNAKVLEFLSRPEVWRCFPEQTAEITRFIQSMCRGPFMFRRVSAPRLELIEKEGNSAHYVHSLMHVKPDLSQGTIVVGVRFHDKRTADHLSLTGNSISFQHKGRQFTIDVREGVNETEAVQQGHCLTLRYAAELHFIPRWKPVRLGRFTYQCTIDARSMLIGVEAVLEVDRHCNIADVELNIGHDNLSHSINEVRYDTVAASIAGTKPASFSARGASTHLLSATRAPYFLSAPGAPYYSITQTEIAGFALAIHTMPRQPERLIGLQVRARGIGKLDRVQARYRFDGNCRGEHLAVSEDKLLTSGGFYGRMADYAALMVEAMRCKEVQQSALDYSISYDYGAEINALAKCYAGLVSEQDPPSLYTSVDELHEFINKYIDYYEALFVEEHCKGQNTILSRQLAFVILATVTMYRVTKDGAYLTRTKRLCEVLLNFEVQFKDVVGRPASGFPYGIASHRSVFVDGQSASLLALTQAVQFINDPRFITAIDRGLRSYCVETSSAYLGNRVVEYNGLATSIRLGNGHLHTENAFWNFNVGLALRLFAALRRSPNSDLQAIVAHHRGRIELFELVLHWQLQRSITERDGLVEIRTSVLSGETNSETQPWVMLGLLGHPYE